MEELIESHILNNYEELKSYINKFTNGYHVNHAILTGIAQGDRKTTTSFKRAHVSFEEGMDCVEQLIEKEIIEIESSQNFLANSKDNDTTKKLLFTAPILRFWFAFISPIYKGIKQKDYTEFKKLYENRKHEFSDFIIEELMLDFIEDFYKEEKVKIIGKYWNKDSQIDIVAKTQTDKVIVGHYLNSNKKIKKASLSKLINDSKKANLKADVYVLFSKNGFSNELKSMKSENLRLFTTKSFKQLLM